MRKTHTKHLIYLVDSTGRCTRRCFLMCILTVNDCSRTEPPGHEVFFFNCFSPHAFLRPQGTKRPGATCCVFFCASRPKCVIWKICRKPEVFGIVSEALVTGNCERTSAKTSCSSGSSQENCVHVRAGALAGRRRMRTAPQPCFADGRSHPCTVRLRLQSDASTAPTIPFAKGGPQKFFWFWDPR